MKELVCVWSTSYKENLCFDANTPDTVVRDSGGGWRGHLRVVAQAPMEGECSESEESVGKSSTLLEYSL
jgi:hypothetical protein